MRFISTFSLTCALVPALSVLASLRGQLSGAGLESVDRASDGTLWVVHQQSTDETTDDRGCYLWVPERGWRWKSGQGGAYMDLLLLALPDGDALVRSGERAYRLYSVDEQLIEVLSGNVRLRDFERRGDLWLTWGGILLPSKDEQGDAGALVSLHDGLDRDLLTGVLIASFDGGHEWRVVDSVPRSWIDEVYLGDDGQVVMVLDGGGIRGGRLEADGSLEVETWIDPWEDSEHRPFLQGRPHLSFEGERDGWLSGSNWYDGDVLYRTKDGGRTWATVEEGAWRNRPTFRLGNGSNVRWAGDRTLQLLRAGELVPLREFDADLAICRVDALGSLLVILRDGSFFAYDGAQWETLPRFPVE